MLHIVESTDVTDLYKDEDSFAAFVHFVLSSTIRKSTWRLGRNKKMISQLFTIHDEALALLLLENSSEGWRDVANGVAVDKRNLKTKYTCKGKSVHSDGGRGWTDNGMRRFSALTDIVRQSRSNGQRVEIEARLKRAYTLKTGYVQGGHEDDSEDEGDDEQGASVRREPVYVDTGIPI